MSDDELREKLVTAYRQRRRVVFDEVATALEGKVLDVLVAAITPGKREEIDLTMTPIAERKSYLSWLEDDIGPDAGLALAALCRDHLFGLRSRAESRDQYLGIDPLREYAKAFGSRAETPWILFEIIRGAPKGLELVARDLQWSIQEIGEHAFGAYRYALIARDDWRSEYARRLRSGKAIDVDLAFLTIDDPEVHRYTEPVLMAHAAAHIERLREIVEGATSTDPKVREFALRILRTADKDLTPEGAKATTPLEKVEADLRRDPNDAEASQVWADALSETGDPRGTYVSLEHAIRAAGDAARAFELSTEQATVLRESRNEVLGRPGGFPFREPFAGRGMIRVASEEPFHVPGLKPALVFERAQALVRALGDVTGPSQVFFADYRRQAIRETSDAEVEPSNLEERGFLELLAPARLFRGREGQTYVERDDPTAPIRHEPILAGLIRRTTALTLVYLFAHVHDGVPLPYQEDVRLPNRLDTQRGRLCSRLQLVPHAKKESFIDFVFPFESVEDPAFVSRYEAVADALGSLPASALSFSCLAPNPNALLRPDPQPIKVPKGFGKKKI